MCSEEGSSVTVKLTDMDIETINVSSCFTHKFISQMAAMGAKGWAIASSLADLGLAGSFESFKKLSCSNRAVTVCLYRTVSTSFNFFKFNIRHAVSLV